MLVYLLLLSFTCWIILKALHNPDLFRGIDTKLHLVKELVSESYSDNNSKDYKIPLAPEKIIQLKKYMEDEEPYTNASLTLNELSTQMNFIARELSILINHHLGQHFYDFVNEYRIKKAMEILKDAESSELTVLEILYQVGFNSKSSFNTAFKKYTHLTPTEYRRKNIVA